MIESRERREWWRRGESNPRPRRCERRALPTELRPRFPVPRVRRNRANPPSDRIIVLGRGPADKRPTARASALGLLGFPEGAQQRGEQIERQRKEGGGVPLRRDLPHGLQIAKLHRDR